MGQRKKGDKGKERWDRGIKGTRERRDGTGGGVHRVEDAQHIISTYIRKFKKSSLPRNHSKD